MPVRALSILALSMPIFASVMSTTMLSIVFPELGQVMSASLADLQIRNIIFFAIFAGLLPFFGKLVDRTVPTKQLITGLVLFAGGCTGSLFSAHQKLWSAFLISQAVMALADSMIVPAVIRLIRLRFKPDEMGWAFGTFSAVLSAATLTGPALAGVCNTWLGWSSIFYFLAGLACLAFVGVQLLVIPQIPQKIEVLAQPKTDGLLGSLALAVLIFSLQQGTQLWLLVAMAVVALAANEALGRESSRLFPNSLWKNQKFLVASGAVFCLFLVSNAISLFVPSWLRTTVGVSTGEVTMLLMIDSAVILCLGSWAGSRLDRNFWPTLMAGLTFTTVSLVALALPPVLNVLAYYAIVFAVIGLGSAIVSPAMNTLAMSAAPQDQTGSYMGIFQLLQFSSGAFAAGLFSHLTSDDGKEFVSASGIKQLFTGNLILVGLTLSVLAFYYFVFQKSAEARS